MKTANCSYPDCKKEAKIYCSHVLHKQYGRVTAGWCLDHHPNLPHVEKVANSKMIYEDNMGVLKYGKRIA